MRTVFALAFALLLAAGCAQTGNSPAQPLGHAQPGDFLVPESRVNYTAKYVLNENGDETAKSVWRAGRRMRVDLQGALSLFFLESRAYSCSTMGGGERCFDISGSIGNGQAGAFFAQPDLSSAEKAEEVDIGGMKGRCYLFPTAPFQSRKMCFTPDGVMAYDEYNGTGGSRRVEYLTELDYSVSPLAFELPAQPEVPPQN